MRLCSPTIALLFVFGSICAGCGKGSESNPAGEAKPAGQQAKAATATAAKPAAEADAMWEKMVGLMEEVARLAEANQNDCAKMATEIDASLNRAEKFLAKAKAVEKGRIQDRTMQEKYQPRMMAALAKLMPAMKNCQANKALGDALKKLDP